MVITTIARYDLDNHGSRPPTMTGVGNQHCEPMAENSATFRDSAGMT